MATGSLNAQEALKTCDEHEHKELSFFCETCKKFICISCGKTTHHGHDWDLVSSIAKERRIETPNLCRRIKKKHISKCRKSICGLDTILEEKILEDSNKLEEQRKIVINLVNEIVDEKKKRRNDLANEQIKEIKGLEKKLDYLDKMTTSLDTNIAAYSDYDVIDMEQQMMKVVTEVESYDVDVNAVTFVPGELDRGLIEGMIGEIDNGTTTEGDDSASVEGEATKYDDDSARVEGGRNRDDDDRIEEEETVDDDDTVSIEEIKTWKEFHDMIKSIVPISDTQAWVGDNRSTVIKLLSCHNVIAYRRSLTSFCDFITLNNGDFIVTSYKNREIRRVTATGEESVLVCTKPLHPTYISKTQTDDMLVILRDGGDLYKLQPSSRRLVQRMTLTGNVLHTYEFREDGVTRLFTWPQMTAENSNSDICVTNLTSGTTGELIVLHADGRVRFTYHGQEGSEFKFCPFAVACDSKSRIIVSDGANKCLHLLSPDGTFLRYLMSDMFGHPTIIALYQDKLWIGFHKGAVKVYKYTA